MTLLLKGEQQKSRKARVFLAVLGFFFFSTVAVILLTPRDQSAPPLAASAVTQRKDQMDLIKDGDSDGLKDWEEAIYRTDPQKADTDGDSIADGDEIKYGRDPLKPGPNDKLATTTITATGQDARFLEPDNLTGRLAEKLNEYVTIPKLANPNSPIDLQTRSEQIVTETLANAPRVSATIFTYADVIIKNESTRNTLAEYDTATDRIVNDAFKNTVGSPLEIFSAAMQQENLSRLAELDSFTTAYTKTIDKLKKLPAPRAAAPMHVELLNTLATQRAAIEAMRRAGEDPVKGLVGAQQYAQAAESIKNLIERFRLVYASS